MNPPREDDCSTAAKPGGRTRWFRNAQGPRLSADEAKRESRVIRVALESLGMLRAEAFLNGFDASLDGRPLAIAMRSQEGAVAVERVIASLQAAAG